MTTAARVRGDGGRPVARPFSKVPSRTLSLAPLIGDAIKRIHTGGSVGELFR